MITLNQFPPAFNLPNASPFCLKLELIHAPGVADIDALAALLGDQAYFLGERPSAIDAVAAAFLANILMVPLETPIKSAASGHANLGAYCQRMAQEYFPAG